MDRSRSRNMIDAAYAAGLFDGDGSVSIIVRRRARCRPWHELSVQLQMCRPEAPEWLAAHFGGGVSLYVKDGVRQFKWTIYTANAGRFLRGVLPHLTTRRRSAEIALQFAETIGPRGRNRLADGEFERRESMRQALLVENKRRLRAA